ncbi:hypothetical protein HYFRA_00013061 [Hymenoscyphus fraxineus]|uniref:Uncharacterized protein n=1 Tax=Hymenoscyphus fraxineus TaxID=746836 RepID=A0A9N9L3J3_9HELO|nr:hypothetical protein HYFRA_00013061 [Hymenoscyphus fraxineus]
MSNKARTQNITQTPLQIAEAKKVAAGKRYIEVRYRAFEHAQNACGGRLREEIIKVVAELGSMRERYERELAENDPNSSETARVIDKLTRKALDLQNPLLGISYLKEEREASDDLSKAFWEFYLLKKVASLTEELLGDSLVRRYLGIS